MITREQVLQALSHLLDPELNRSLVDLHLIRDVVVKDHAVHMTVLLREEYEAWKQTVQSEVNSALRTLGDYETHIRFRLMTEFELSEFHKQLSSVDNESQANPSNSHLDDMQKKTQAELKNQPKGAPKLLQDNSPTTFIAIASGKGGVGKSTVTVNLAVALARRGRKVGLIDADIYGFSVPDMMGIEKAPELIDEAIQPVESHGVKVISMGFFVQDNAPVIWRGPMLGKMLRNFFNEVSWGELDYLLLDLPPGTGDIALDVHQMIPQSKEIIVTTPHATAAFVAARAGAMAKHTNHDVLGVVENMAYYECSSCGTKDYVFGRGGGAKLAEELHTELLAQIPLGAPDNHPAEPDFSPSIYKADHPAGQLYLSMADRIVEKTR